MARVTPPPDTTVTHIDGDPLYRLKFRLWQLSIATITIFVTCWMFSLDIIAGLAALFLAKHVLVALFIAGYQLPPPSQENEQA